MNEISCWYVNWNAIGAFGSGAAAFIALIIWIVSMLSKYLAERKRVRVYRHLLTEELARISTACVFLYDNPELRRSVFAHKGKVDMLLANLQLNQINELIRLSDHLPSRVAEGIAKLAAIVEMIRQCVEYAYIEVSQGSADAAPGMLSQRAMEAFDKYSPHAIVQALDVARAFDKYGSKEGRGLYHSVNLPRRALMQSR